MRKNKILATIAGMTTVGILSVSASATIVNKDSQTKTQESNEELALNYQATTGAACEINEDITDKRVVKLNAEIIGDATIGSTLSLNVKGFNKSDQEVELDKSKLKYSWLTERVVKLNAEIIGDATIGSTLSLNVKGFNKSDQEVELDKSKLKYSWLTEDNEILGNESELKINENMDGTEIHCNVSYAEN